MENLNLININTILETEENISISSQIENEVTTYEILHGTYTIVSVICFSIITFYLYKYLKTVFKLRR